MDDAVKKYLNNMVRLSKTNALIHRCQYLDKTELEKCVKGLFDRLDDDSVNEIYYEAFKEYTDNYLGISKSTDNFSPITKIPCKCQMTIGGIVHIDNCPDNPRNKP